MAKIDSTFLISFFRRAGVRMEEQRQMLCSLDGEIGDGDHGTSMANGFAAINARLRELDAESATPSAILRNAASAFIGEVGATVGPLYATALLQGAGVLDEEPLDDHRLGDLLAAFARGISMRGKAEIGDKTMLDAWLPASQAAQRIAAEGGSASAVARAAAEAAATGADTTRSMVAARGRAARLKERSLGHRDPGAVSASLIVRAFAEILEESE